MVAVQATLASNSCRCLRSDDPLQAKTVHVRSMGLFKFMGMLHLATRLVDEWRFGRL